MIWDRYLIFFNCIQAVSSAWRAATRSPTATSSSTRAGLTARHTSTPSEDHCAPDATNPSPAVASRPCSGSSTRSTSFAPFASSSWTRERSRSRARSLIVTNVMTGFLVSYYSSENPNFLSWVHEKRSS